MERIVYLNGKFLAESEAKVSVFDRGFLFADAVYEVTAVLDGKLIDHEGHLARLERSAKELGIKMPVTGEQLMDIQRQLIEKNSLVEGGIYLQLTRGNEGDRDFSYSDKIEPTLVLFTQSRNLIDSPKAQTGIKVISFNDIRWRRRDIKTTSLLPACLAKQIAHEAGAEDVWLIENGYVTEGGSSNAYIVTQDDVLVTRPLSNDILHGITRASLMTLAKELNLTIEERFFTIEEAYQAKEAFISSATTFVWPVVAIDDKPIGSGKPGEIALRLRDIYIKTSKELAV
ncbi:D-amino-acid transaminase [Vibrio natriegens]|uniref:Aminodeoxychorismate lyase n=1 Tax=Vibrio natriegens NBRC 15636 = ATCC 14048 = DSM 759 TaxID=1219067 RepID=A0AAN0Y6J3_VIBNA|nr:D-amino-acid transaminase [Vibrio natriegens]ALR18757.1 D-amino acid aminotransferase [Vibrio natriegens NBRC 15636 = ATCC 14048 = DSM 759]ANQ14724.1 D-amino acid aminotransferase [Vibrio natriegens NBRC 15636 = ATCC 14048 = DSM 759]EPM39767.1 D-amino acid aminotransferase [Vibrio natriegens NBRC 15636 = ATCC 14048 = DSM 759]MCG9701732.1 D-amino-acid transaminase [Vibrio natriegens]MDX6028308.1 D-amino-acid transaminase [Vibrio natriegens NBRC 15636 = ATCC 14048 = DSM 759]